MSVDSSKVENYQSVANISHIARLFDILILNFFKPSLNNILANVQHVHVVHQLLEVY